MWPLQNSVDVPLPHLCTFDQILSDAKMTWRGIIVKYRSTLLYSMLYGITNAISLMMHHFTDRSGNVQKHFEAARANVSIICFIIYIRTCG